MKEYEKQFEYILEQIRSYNENADFKKIKNAWEFAKLSHHEQKRLTGDPYISHCLAVAQYLADWKLDTTTIIAGLLHDTIEDGGAKREDINKEFGADVSYLVEGMTNVRTVKLRGQKEEEFVENLRKMILVMAEDLRVVFIRLADKLHNLETISALKKKSQIKNAKEIMEVYAPLAERLGIGQIKGKLEDLSFPILYPSEYEKIIKESRVHYKKTSAHIKKMTRHILKSLAKEGIKAKVGSRQKHLYSLWKKLERPEINWDFEKVHDIVALRIIVDEIPECYSALGLVHRMYKPVPNIGISDFIAQPKPNGYRSIHTKVFGPGGRIVEVQIRTFEMHEQAEYGLAAHWSYSRAKSSGVKVEILEKGILPVKERKLKWVKQLVEWQKEITDSEEFLKAVKFDALSQRIFVFSPKGDVYDLPKGATPVDFAYNVHTHLGNYIKSAKVNKKMVPLDYQLKSGDVCEIEKTKNPKAPSKGWVEFVATTTARREINKYLRKD